MVEVNGEFETNTTGWVALSGGSIARQTTTFHAGAASANVTSAGSSGSGSEFDLVVPCPAGSTWDVSGYLQAHGSGDAGRLACVEVVGVDGTFEAGIAPDITLTQNGWQFDTLTYVIVQANHTTLGVRVIQHGAGAAMNIDADSLVLARHLSYLPGGDPRLTHLWVPGIPAGAHAQPVQATTAALIASGLYAGA